MGTPFFIGHFKNVDKRGVVKPKKNTVFFAKGKKKKEKEKTFSPRSTKSDLIFDKEPAPKPSPRTLLTAVPLILKVSPGQPRRKPFLNEGPSKRKAVFLPLYLSLSKLFKFA